MVGIFHKNLFLVHLIACIHIHPWRKLYRSLQLRERTILRSHRRALERLSWGWGGARPPRGVGTGPTGPPGEGGTRHSRGVWVGGLVPLATWGGQGAHVGELVLHRGVWGSILGTGVE